MSDSLQLHGLHNLPGSSVHGILQARTLEWVAIPFSRGSSRRRDQIQVFRIAGRFFTIWYCRRILYHLSRQGSLEYNGSQKPKRGQFQLIVVCKIVMRNKHQKTLESHL